ncbi:MAG TPA: hypothetical protein PLZ57_14055 [Pseudobdellovibrionaceae bacterium]|nr:hypothetical protein [Pseudobdellovibrionaceae bacterium]
MHDDSTEDRNSKLSQQGPSEALRPEQAQTSSAPLSELKSSDRKTKSVAQLAHALRELEGALSAWDQESSAKAAAPAESLASDRRDLKRGISPEELRRKTRELLIELKAQIDEL